MHLVVKDVVDDREVRASGIDRVLLIHVRPAADVVEDVAVEGEVILAAIQVDAARAQRTGRIVPVPDVFDFVPSDRNVMGVGIGMKTVHAGVLDDEPLDDYVSGVAQVEVSPGAVTTQRTLGAGGGIENGAAAVLRHDRDGVSGRAGVGHRDHGAAATGIGDLPFVVIRAVHHGDGVSGVGRRNSV